MKNSSLKETKFVYKGSEARANEIKRRLEKHYDMSALKNLFDKEVSK